MPLAMRPLRDQMAHCRRTLRLPSALTRSPRRSRGLTPCERLVSGSTSNEITSCQATSRSCRALFRLRIRTVVLGDALNECATNVCPTHPPYGGICEDILLADAALLLKFLTYSRFVKEQRRKISRAVHNKFSAPLTTTENGIINTRAERFPAPRLNCFMTRRTVFGGLFSRRELGGIAAIKQLGTGQKCQIFKQFCPVPNCLIFQDPTAILINPFISLTALFR